MPSSRQPSDPRMWPPCSLIYSVEGAPQPIALTAVRAALQALLFILPAALATSKASTSK